MRENLRQFLIFTLFLFVFINPKTFAQTGFLIQPQAIDNADGDAVFSPNGDGVQDSLFVVLTMDGSIGEFRMMIDTHSDGGIGQPDGVFDPDDDWTTTGRFGLGTEFFSDARIITVEWDGRDRHTDQGTPRKLADGTYQIQIEIDFLRDNSFNPPTSDHTVKLNVTIDTADPKLSAVTDLQSFSPNSDAINENTQISYSLSESLKSLDLEFTNVTNRPSISLSDLTAGDHAFSWNGNDGLGKTFSDGNISVQLKAIDLGGNSTAFPIGNLQIDTISPTISATSPTNRSFVNRSIDSVSANFDALNGSQIDFNTSIIDLKNANGESISGTLASGGNTLTLNLDQILSENGTFTINATAVDLAGNRSTSTTTFTLDTIAPTATTLLINDLTAKTVVNSQITFVESVMGDNIGVDLDSSTIRLQRNGNEINGVQSVIGTDRMRWTLTQPLRTDGFDDGNFSIVVNVADLAGNSSQRQIDLVYDTTAPTLVSTTPNFSIEKTLIDQPLSLVTLDLSDGNGIGIDFANSVIKIKKDTTEISAKITQNANQIQIQPTPQITDLGDYTIEITLADLAGNVSELINYSFFVAIDQPIIEWISPNTGTSDLTAITAQIQNYSGFGLDFANSAIVVKSSDGAIINGSITNNQQNEITWQISDPLSRDGSSDGIYTATATFADLESKKFTLDYQITFDSQSPKIVSTTPKNAKKINSLEKISVTLSDQTVGVDLAQTTVNLKKDGVPISAFKTDNGTDLITLTFDPRQTDGTDDGVYQIEITPVDLVGNVGNLSIVEFILATEIPEISDVTPVKNSVLNQISEISAILIDKSGKGIDLDKSSITVVNPNGEAINGKISNDDQQTIRLSDLVLASDGSADGVYTITVSAIDKIGTTAELTQNFTFDTQPPTLTTEIADRNFVSDPKISLDLNVSDATSRVDFSATTINLTDPNGSQVETRITNNGNNSIKFSSADLTKTGIYTLSIALVDIAGNSNVPQNFEFVHEISAPKVVSISPKDQSKINSLIIFSIDFESQNGLDFSTVGTNFDLRNSQNQIIDLNYVIDGTTVTLTPDRSIATDGSNDGDYTLTFQLIDLNGNASQSETIAITYDSQPPMISDVSSIDETGNLTYVNNSISRFEAIVTDLGTGVDFDQTQIKLADANGNAISGKLGHDSQKIWFQLDLPITTDGDLDGKYQIQILAVDLAENQISENFDLWIDTQSPTRNAFAIDWNLIASVPNLGTIESSNSVSIVMAQDDGTTIEISNAQLFDPQNSQIDIVQSQIGNTIKLDLPNLTLKNDGSSDGVYRLQVTADDLAGNSAVHQFEFLFETTRLLDTEPIGRSFVTSLDLVKATLGSTTAIDFENSKIRLLNPNGDQIAGRQETDPDQRELRWILSAEIPTDGSADGVYTIHVELSGGQIFDEKFTIDTTAPIITIVKINTTIPIEISETKTIEILENFDRLTIQLSDLGSGVRISNTTVRLTNPNGSEISVNRTANTTDQINLKFAPLDLLGVHTLTATPTDHAGNVGRTAIFRFERDQNLPKVTSVEIGQFLKTITAKFENAELEKSTIGVIGPSGAIEGVSNLLSGDEIVWTAIGLSTDGSDDGIYTVTVTPIDRYDRNGTPSITKFTLDTQLPEVASTTIIDTAQPITYLSQPITQIAVEVADQGPAGLDLMNQKVDLVDQNGNSIAKFQTHDNDRMIFFTLKKPFAKNGSSDGEYKFMIDLVDKVGNKNSVSHKIVFDTQPPKLISANPANGVYLTEPISKITATLEDPLGSGIDFNNTKIMLNDSDENQIVGKLSHDGKSDLVLEIDSLVGQGAYVLKIEASDLAGNSATYETGFIYTVEFPIVRSTTPSAIDPDDSFNNQKVDEIVLNFEIGTAEHLSTVFLQDENGRAIAGEQFRKNDFDQLYYRLAKPLKADGSHDGNYTIVFTPISRSGQKGGTQNFTFLHDTVPPMIDQNSITLSVVDPNVNNALTEISFRASDPDPSSGFDWDDAKILDLQLNKITPNDDLKISGDVSIDQSNGGMAFRLDQPLAIDGSQDGVYVLKLDLIDRAQNVLNWSYDFVYDTKPPVIDLASLTLNDQPIITDVNDENYPTIASANVIIGVKLSDANGQGIDLARSSISVQTPNGNQIQGNVQQNGIDQLIFTASGPLTAEGIYKIAITSVGLDPDHLGFQPTTSLITEFLYETTPPIAILTHRGDSKTENDPLVIEGTAEDPESNVSASGVLRVELIGTDANGDAIEPVLAEDLSEGDEDDWTNWRIEYLPTKSGEYELSVRVTDRAGNAETYEKLTVDFSISLSFRGEAFAWRNPVSHAQGDLAHISFDPNVPNGETVNIDLFIYDLAGNLVFKKSFPNIEGGRNDQLITWHLKNAIGDAVASGVYIFRLFAEDRSGETANAIGKILVVK